MTIDPTSVSSVSAILEYFYRRKEKLEQKLNTINKMIEMCEEMKNFHPMKDPALLSEMPAQYGSKSNPDAAALFNQNLLENIPVENTFSEKLREEHHYGYDEAMVHIATRMIREGEPIEKIQSYSGYSQEKLQNMIDTITKGTRKCNKD